MYGIRPVVLFFYDAVKPGIHLICSLLCSVTQSEGLPRKCLWANIIYALINFLYILVLRFDCVTFCGTCFDY